MELKQVFFTRMLFEHNIEKPLKEIKLKIANNFKFFKANEGKIVKLQVLTDATDETLAVRLSLVTEAIIEFPEGGFDEKVYGQTIVDMVYPYIKSEIGQITTTPGFVPIILPFESPKVQFVQKDPEIVA